MTQNYFEIFQLPLQFNINEKKLDESYRSILKSIHPDRFVNATEAEKKLSLSKSTQINDAYQILKNPIQRAQYLLKLNNVVQEKSLDNEFLIKQMEWEEKLEENSNLKYLNQFSNEIKEIFDQKLKTLQNLIDHDKKYDHAIFELAKLKFLSKLDQKIKDKIFLLTEN